MDAQTALFQQHRQRLFGLAYRMHDRGALL